LNTSMLIGMSRKLFWRGFGFALLLVAVQVATLAADNTPKSYPEKGRVVAGNISEHTDYAPIMPTDSKGRTHGGEAFVHRNWVYRVETDDGVYELAGGKNQTLNTADAIEFRISKGTARVRDGDKEKKYRIISQPAK
jgi:hypothetical protein